MKTIQARRSLVRLFEDNTDPRAIVLGFVQGQEYMSRGWVQALIASQGKSDDYQIMQRVAGAGGDG